MEQLFEIVHVITATQLIDSESYQRTLGGVHRLRPGFYVVRWSSTATMSRYDDNADFTVRSRPVTVRSWHLKFSRSSGPTRMADPVAPRGHARQVHAW